MDTSSLAAGDACPGYNGIAAIPCSGHLVIDRGAYDTDTLTCDTCSQGYGDPVVVPVRVGGACPGVRGQRSSPCSGTLRQEDWGARCDACGHEILASAMDEDEA